MTPLTLVREALLCLTIFAVLGCNDDMPLRANIGPQSDFAPPALDARPEPNIDPERTADEHTSPATTPRHEEPRGEGEVTANPRKGEAPSPEDHDVLAKVEGVGHAESETPATESPADTDSRLDLNTATAAELDALPGIGPSMAGRILAYRDKREFRRVRDLKRIRGVGPATYRKLEPLVKVE